MSSTLLLSVLICVSLFFCLATGRNEQKCKRSHGTDLEKEKAPIHIAYPVAKHTKRSKFSITDRHARKTSELFLLYDTGVDFSSRNNFANLGLFAKVSVPVQSIIPWLAFSLLQQPSLRVHAAGKSVTATCL